MYSVKEKKVLNSNVTMLKISAPHIAKKVKAGQFIILRVNEQGERIPLTVADFDREDGTITIIFQLVGKTTKLLNQLTVDDNILDVVGPLGCATEIEGYKNVAVVGGGVGCAIAFPEAKALFNSGANVDVIAGFRNKDIVILEDEFNKVSTNLYITTDDGSYVRQGFVTQVLKEQIDAGKNYDLVIAIGPLPMMRAVSNLTKEYNIKTIISMNPIMIDGTGMCGGCRIKVGGEIKFACVDGPEFDGHLVDFEDAMKRSGGFKSQEQHACKMHGGENNA